MNSLGPHRRRCLPLWPASSDKQFLITLWWRTSESRPFQQCSEECVILEAKFRGGGKSVFIQSRPDSNRDSPHCGQTSNQLVICPFSCSDCCKSPNPLNTARKKETDGRWFCFHLCGRLDFLITCTLTAKQLIRGAKTLFYSATPSYELVFDIICRWLMHSTSQTRGLKIKKTGWISSLELIHQQCQSAE